MLQRVRCCSTSFVYIFMLPTHLYIVRGTNDSCYTSGGLVCSQGAYKPVISLFFMSQVRVPQIRGIQKQKP